MRIYNTGSCGYLSGVRTRSVIWGFWCQKQVYLAPKSLYNMMLYTVGRSGYALSKWETKLYCSAISHCTSWTHTQNAPCIQGIDCYARIYIVDQTLMTLKNNRAPLLFYVKLCATFQSHRGIQTGVTVWKCEIQVKIGDFCPLWPWNLTDDLEKRQDTSPK